MDNEHILLRCITLLFREAQLENNFAGSQGLVTEVLATVSAPDMSAGLVDTNRDIITGLKFICTKMAASVGEKFEQADILQKVRSVTVHDETLFIILKEGIEGELTQESLAGFCLSIRKELGQHIRDEKAKEIVKDANKKMRKGEDGMSITELAAKLLSDIEPYANTVKEADPAVVGSFFLKDLDMSAKQFNDAKDLNDEAGIMRTGHQGINRMLGGGLRRGYEVVIGALQHNYKTGFTKQIVCEIPRYNTPYMIDAKRKPLIISISFEDPLALNMPFVFKVIWENKYHEPAPQDKTAQEMATFVNEEIGINGYDMVFMHVNPTLWTYRDIQNCVLYYESLGYEVHCLLLDYLAMVPTTGCNNAGPIGSDIRDMFRRLRNFCSPKKITLVTPHQLSTEAKMLIRNGLEDTFVQEIANKGYYDSCKTIDQEVDLEMYIHKVIFNGRAWLTVQRGKHRLTVQTPEEFKYCVLLFEDIGNIREDVNGPDTTRAKIGSNPIGSKDGKQFWEFEE